MGKGRAPCCDKSKVKRGPWSPAEDLKLITFIQKNGHDNWRSLPKQAGLLRCGKSCRLRWINYLRPDVKRGNFTQDEEETIFKLHETLGNKWSKIASHFPGRTDNEIKNVWNTHLKKKKPKNTDDPSGGESKESSIITSSSSSSLTTISCHKKRDPDFVLAEEEYSDPPKRLRNSTPEKEEEDEEEGNNDEFSFQLEEDPNKEQVMMVSTTTSSDSSCGSNISNESSVTIIDQVDDVSRLGDHDEVILIDNLLLDYEGPYDEFSDKSLDDQELVMSSNNEYGLWEKLDDATLFEFNNNQDQLVLHNNNLETRHNGEIENNKEWFKYLETELGLEPTTTEINTNNNDISYNNKNNLGFDQDYSKIIEELVLLPDCNFFDIETKTEFSPPSLELFSPSYELLWPSDLPQNSPAI